MITIGFDPGLSGAVSFIDDDGDCTIEDLPTVKVPGNGLVTRKIDGRTLSAMLRRRLDAGQRVVAFVEEQRAMGGRNNALQTQGSVMRTFGTIEGVLEALGIDYRLVSSHTWRSIYGLGNDKKAAVAVARRLYPGAPLTLAKHHNRAESLLIAHHGMRTLGA